MKWLVLILALPFILVAGGLILNRPPLFSPPGPLERLKTYLTTNVAETRPEHPFQELRPQRFSVDAERLQAVVLEAMRSLDWSQIQPAAAQVQAVVVSPLFRFRDDVTVRIEAEPEGAVLQARSASRVGKGDLAANSRHLQDLFARIRRLVADANAEPREG